MEGEASATRRFGLADLMILVVATAVGLVPLKATRAVTNEFMSSGGQVWWTAISVWTSGFLACVAPLLLSWVIASLALASRRPRPPLRRLMQEPGIMLGVAATVGAAYTTAAHLPALYLAPREPRMIFNMLLDWVRSIGMATAGAWSVLFCLGLARRSFGWPDRLGRALSLGWILLLAMSLVHRGAYFMQLLF